MTGFEDVPMGYRAYVNHWMFPTIVLFAWVQETAAQANGRHRCR